MAWKRTLGEQVDGWNLVRPLGAGGYGEVWEAHRHSERGAIKFLTLEDREARVRFAGEARVLAEISHPNCVRILADGIAADGSPYLVTQYVDGQTLLPWALGKNEAELCRAARDIAHALAAIHARGITHRDLKPDNVLVSLVDDQWHVYLLDFGIAKVVGRVDQNVTKTGVALGTPGFMSPEQLRGLSNVGAPTDMYAFGCLLFAMFAGRPPFDGESAIAISMQHLQSAPPPLPVGPPFVVALVRDLLEKEPRRRPTASVAANRLSTRGIGPSTNPVMQPRTHSPRVVVAILGLLVALAAGVYLTFDQDPAEPVPVPVQTRVTSIVKVAAPTPNERPAAVDLDADDARDFGPPECASLHPFTPGFEQLSERLIARFPESYAKGSRHPVIVMFHDAFQTEADIIRNLDPLVLRQSPNDYVLLAVGGPELTELRGHWMDEKVNTYAFETIDAALGDLCVNPEQIMVLGYGAGGRGAVQYACSRSAAGIATFAYRWPLSQRETRAKCEHGESIPSLMIFPDADSIAPIDGSAQCGLPPRISVEATIASVRDDSDCSGEGTTTKEKDGSCTRHDCATPLETCIVHGGRAWRIGPGHNELATLIGRATRGCADGPVTEFHLTAKILGFFDELLAPQPAVK